LIDNANQAVFDSSQKRYQLKVKAKGKKLEFSLLSFCFFGTFYSKFGYLNNPLLNRQISVT
jgi:hypothetical protein